MDVTHIKGVDDWDFEIPEITAEAINDFIAALARDEHHFMDIYLDGIAGCSREMSDPDEEQIIRNYYLHGGWRKDVESTV